MEGHVVLDLGVYAFDDVDFAVAGPVGADKPASFINLARILRMGKEKHTRQAMSHTRYQAYAPDPE